jgi:hypothetical protein
MATPIWTLAVVVGAQAGAADPVAGQMAPVREGSLLGEDGGHLGQQVAHDRTGWLDHGAADSS